MKKAKSSMKSGTETACANSSYLSVLGGQPGEKDVKGVDKANMPKSAPRSVGN